MSDFDTGDEMVSNTCQLPRLGDMAHHNDHQAIRARQPESKVPVLYDESRVEDLVRQLVPVISRGLWPIAQQKVLDFQAILESQEKSDYLTDLLPLRLANLITEVYGYQRLHELQELSVSGLRALGGVGEGTIKRIQKLMDEQGMRLAE